MGNVVEFCKDNWFVFRDEESKRLGVSHLCTGDTTHSKIERQFKISKVPGFNPTGLWKSGHPVCISCKRTIPEGIVILVQVENTRL